LCKVLTHDIRGAAEVQGQGVKSQGHSVAWRVQN